MQMNLRIVERTVPLVLVFICMYLPDGQQAEQQKADIGIMQCNVNCIKRGSSFASDIDTLFCYVSNTDARQWSMRGFVMSFASDIDKLACPLSQKDERHKTMRGFVTFSKKTTQISTGVCPYGNCKSNTRCVKRRRGGAICIENWKSTLNNVNDNDREYEGDGEDKNEITRTRDKGSNPLESRCSTNTDCPADRKFVFFKRTCKCVPGYSFNPANNSCVRRCKSYGDSFTTYYGLGIHGNNDRSSTINVKGCRQQCIRENAFTCITCETHNVNRRCNISRSGYLDVEPREREKGSWFWSISMKNCA